MYRSGDITMILYAIILFTVTIIIFAAHTWPKFCKRISPIKWVLGNCLSWGWKLASPLTGLRLHGCCCRYADVLYHEGGNEGINEEDGEEYIPEVMKVSYWKDYKAIVTTMLNLFCDILYCWFHIAGVRTSCAVHIYQALRYKIPIVSCLSCLACE